MNSDKGELTGPSSWAYSVQARFAEKSAADFIRSMNETSEFVPSENPHMRELSRRLEALGIPHGVGDIPPNNPLHELDEPWARRVVDGILVELCDFIRIENAEWELDAIVSNLPSGSISAFCAKNSWDNVNYVFVDAELLTFCQLASKAVNLALTGLFDDQGQFEVPADTSHLEAAEPFDEAVLRTVDLIASTIIHGAPRMAQPWVPPDKTLWPSVVTCTCMERFVLAHELSHVTLGHFERAGTFSAQVLEGQDEQAVAFAHEDEFEADLAGFTLAVSAARHRGDESILPYLAPYLFLRVVELYDTALRLFGVSPSGPLSTHPPTADRARAIRAALIEFHHGAELVRQFMVLVDATMAKLSEETIRHLTALKAGGVIAHDRVRDRLLGGERPAILGLGPIAELAATITR